MDEKAKTKHFIFNVFVSLHNVVCGGEGETIPCWDHGKNPKNQFYMHTSKAMFAIMATSKQTKSLK
jgi:hypothetical protein